MSDIRQEIAALIAKWREQASDTFSPQDPASAYNTAIDVCADELEAVLHSRAEQEPRQEEQDKDLARGHSLTQSAISGQRATASKRWR